MNYTITKENGFTKISNEVREHFYKALMSALGEEFGAKNVRMARIGNDVKKNVLMVNAGTLTDEDGCPHDLIVTNEVIVKSYKEKVTKRYTVPVLDFTDSTTAYEEWVKEKTQKALEAQEKAGKRDAKKVEMEKRKAELDAAEAKAKEKLDKKTQEIYANVKSSAKDA